MADVLAYSPEPEYSHQSDVDRAPAEFTELPLLTAEAFADQAADILTTALQATEPRTGEPMTQEEAYRRATEAYITEEENPHLKLLAEVMLTAPGAYRNEKRLNAARAEIERVGRENASEGLKKVRDDLVRAVIDYNHDLRTLIVNNGNVFTREQLEGWIAKSCGGNEVWTKKLVSGVVAEVAGARALDGHPQAAHVVEADVEQDARGVDVDVILRGGKIVPIDFKYGANRPEHEVELKRDGVTVEMCILKEELDGFKIDRRYLDVVYKRFDEACKLTKGR